MIINDMAIGYEDATTSTSGLMSASDKTKLNGIANGATAVTTSTVSGWGYTKNTGTVTSLTLKASSPISINSSSAITTSGTRTLSHANSGVTAGTYGSSTTYPVMTVNATGHVTEVSTQTISALPSVTSSDNGKFLKVVDGAWAVAGETILFSYTWTGNSWWINTGSTYTTYNGTRYNYNNNYTVNSVMGDSVYFQYYGSYSYNHLIVITNGAQFETSSNSYATTFTITKSLSLVLYGPEDQSSSDFIYLTVTY